MSDAALDDAPVPPPEGTLGHRVSRGLKWSVLNLLVNKGLSIASGIVLARILVPADFGVFAVAIAVVNILFGLNDAGLVVAIIRWKGDLRAAARTCMTLAVGLSAVVYAACFALAPAFADAMNAPHVVGMLRLLALTVLIDGFVAVPHGLLVRDFRQDALAKIQFVSSPANFGTAVALGFLGAGAWSLAVGNVVGNLVAAAAFWRYSPLRAGFGFDRPAAKWMLRFGIPMALTSVVEYVLLNADYVVVGAVLGPVQAGFYLLAYNVSNWIVAALTDAVRPVAVAGFAELERGGGEVRDRFVRAYGVLLTAAIPLTIAVVVLAPSIIGFVYGPKWAPSGAALRLLALLGAARVAVGLVTDLLVGTGRSRTTLAVQSAWLVVLVPALVVGAHLGGIRGVGAAHAIVALGVALPLFLATVRVYGIHAAELLRLLRRPAVGGVVAASAAVALTRVVHGDFLRLLALGPAIVASYVVVVVPRHLLGPAGIRQARQRLRGGGAPADAPQPTGLAST